jgi:ABC-2 type transport system permease protein
MSEMNKLGVVIRFEFLKHIRRARLYIVMGIALLAEVLVLILIPALMDKYPDNVIVMAQFLTVGPSLAALGAVFFAGDAIAGEYEGKTGFLLFTNPIKKETLWAGKYLAGLIAVAILMVFSFIIMTVSLLAIYHEVPGAILKSFGLAMFYGAATLSTTFLFSSLSKGSMGATIMTLVFIWVICGILQSVLLFTGNPYWFILPAGGDSITNALGSMQDMMSGFGGLGGFGGTNGMLDRFKPPTLGMVSWGMAIYFVGGFVASIILARRRQLA